MGWKVIDIASGKILKAGFKEEDDAYEWLDGRENLDPAECDIEELDEEEEEELALNKSDDDEDDDEDDDDTERPPSGYEEEFNEYAADDSDFSDDVEDYDNIVNEDELDDDLDDD